MERNIGKTDKAIRIALALIIAAAGIYYKSWLGLIAIVPLATALISWCPAYSPFGISTVKKQ